MVLPVQRVVDRLAHAHVGELRGDRSAAVEEQQSLPVHRVAGLLQAGLVGLRHGGRIEQHGVDLTGDDRSPAPSCRWHLEGDLVELLDRLVPVLRVLREVNANR
jgi:hypothetical protein